MNRLVPPNVAARAQRARRVPIAFGRRAFLLFFIGFVWIAPAWRNTRFLYALAIWDAVVLALWAWDLSWMARPADLELRRVWSEPLGLASQGTIKLELRNFSRTSISAQIWDEAPPTFCRDLPLVQVSVPAQGASTASYPIEPRARGDAAFGDVWLRYQSPLLIAERWARARLAQTVRVYPNIEETQKMRIYLIRSRQIELEKRLKRQRGQGREFESLRDYREGDEFRDISWTATARRGKLITKVHQIERSQVVWLVLDAGRLLRTQVAGLSKLDYTINAALCLAQVAFYSGDRVGLFAYGRKPQQRVGPGRGVPQLRVLLESMAQVRAEPYEADHLYAAEHLLSLQSRRSLIVWLTDLAETAATPEVIECAAKMAGRHLVLLCVMGQPELRGLVAAPPQNAGDMYHYTAALEIVQRRGILLRRVRQQGALTLEVDPRGLSTALVNRYLEVKERSLL
ncbi:MAG TPA: DUF58 domain-containing protein [Candidatus Acidoferrales bacterium]|nr:DUF58 domain-containing protein [Candidatus Acidoferrales bacterium]